MIFAVSSFASKIYVLPIINHVILDNKTKIFKIMIISSYLFPFLMIDIVVSIVFSLKTINSLGQLVLFSVRIIISQMEICSPIGRIKAPMTSTILTIASMTMTNKFGGAKESFALQTLNTLGGGRGVSLREDNASTMTKTFVLNTKTKRWSCGIDTQIGSDWWVPIQKSGAQPFSIWFGDKTTSGSFVRDDFGQLEHIQLLWCTSWTVDLQFVTGSMDGWQAELV